MSTRSNMSIKKPFGCRECLYLGFVIVETVRGQHVIQRCEACETLDNDAVAAGTCRNFCRQIAAADREARMVEETRGLHGAMARTERVTLPENAVRHPMRDPRARTPAPQVDNYEVAQPEISAMAARLAQTVATRTAQVASRRAAREAQGTLFETPAPASEPPTAPPSRPAKGPGPARAETRPMVPSASRRRGAR